MLGILQTLIAGTCKLSSPPRSDVTPANLDMFVVVLIIRTSALYSGDRRVVSLLVLVGTAVIGICIVRKVPTFAVRAKPDDLCLCTAH